MSTQEVQEVRAAAKWLRITPRKARLVVEHIRGRSVPEARTMLAFSERAAAREIDKLLRSAVANAEANHNLIGDDLVVKTAYVDEGPTIKRWRPRARGRAAQIRKHMCHITITLAPATTATVTRAPEPEAPAEEKPKREARFPPEGRDQGGRAEGGGRDEAGGGEEACGQEAGCPKARAGQEEDRGERELMGQKVHPGGMRVGVIHDWKSNWFAGTKEFPEALLEDIKIREHIYNKLSHAGLSDVLIRKDKQRITIDIYTARPGIVIGKSGAEVDALRKEIHAMTHKNVHININEIKRPELDAKLVAQSIAEQLQNRVSFRRAMKRSLASAMRSGAHGVKVQCGGRLGGTEMSRSESYSEGRVPLHTIRADIDYGFVEAKTTSGRIGVKVWINKGEIMPEGFDSVAQQKETRLGDQDTARRRGGRTEGPLGLARERTQQVAGPRGPRPRAYAAPEAKRRAAEPEAGRSRCRGAARGPRLQAPEAAGSRGAEADGRVGRRELVAASEEDEVPQAAARPARRRLERADSRPVRRLRPQVDGSRLGHEPPDRGGSYRHDPKDQARREGLDQRLPGQAGEPEAGRDAHGVGQGRPGALGRRRQARPGHVRAGRCARGPGQGSTAAGRDEAPGEDEVREAGG